MNIVIIGAGDLGRFLAALLSKEAHNVILIDKDAKKLQEASWDLDVATLLGSGTNWQLLDSLIEGKPEIFIAVTTEDDTNLVACSLAKHLGIPRTVARVKDNRFLNIARLDFGQIFDVDFFICPELIVAHDIFKCIKQPSSLEVEYFAYGSMQLRTLKIPKGFSKEGIPLKDLMLPKGVMIGLILRQQPESFDRLIFPHGEDVVMPGDTVTVVGETQAVEEVHHFFDIEQKPIKSAFIAGGSLIGAQLAKILSKRKIQVKLVEKERGRAKELAESLKECTVIADDFANIEFLKEEHLEAVDLFIACSDNDELNIISCLLAQELKVKKIITTIANPSYVNLATGHGIDHVISSRAHVADHILARIVSKRVSSLVSLYGDEVEVVEVIISPESKAVGIPLSDLGPHFPRDFLIAMIQSQGKAFVAHGNKVMAPGDTVMVICAKEHVKDLDKIF